jgi:CBS domain-containing protein
LNGEYLSLYCTLPRGDDGGNDLKGHPMRAKDIMTTGVVTIKPETTIAEIATILIERRFSGLPVLEDGRVVGIVSEGDLLRRHEIDTDRKRPGSWWMRLLRGEPRPADYVKSHAVHAADVMTREVISVSEDEPVAAIAILFGERHIKRVPVLRDGLLVGIVTRANLVQALAARSGDVVSETVLGDGAIRTRLLAELGTQAWWRADSNVLVADGVVHYWGVCADDTEKQAARVAAENVPGVLRVEDHRVRYAELPYSMG